MKMFKFFPLACAAIMMCACSSDDPGDGKGNPNVAGEAQYLAVNIVNVGVAPTRAPIEGKYENGTDEESKISNVRFYFFRSDDTPYILAGTTEPNVNYLEVKPGNLKDDATTDNGIDKVSDAILVIKGVEASAPAKMVAIANPTTVTELDKKKKSLNELQGPIVGTTYYKGDGSSATDFVMSNSVYASENKTVFANSISGYVKTTKAEAEGAPVNVYVERVAAKVRAKLSTDASAKFEDGTDKWNNGKKGIKVGECLGKDIYAVIDGWGLADENTQAYINKQITPTWTSTGLGFGTSLWTTADYHRSFWETSVPVVKIATVTETNAVKNYDFTHFDTAFGNYMFTLPNTSDAAIGTAKNAKYNGNTRTKFLVAAHLMYNNGTNWTYAEVCSYKGIDYLGVESLKKHIAFESGYYVKDATSTNPKGYKRITADDITFVKKDNIDDCLVVAALNNTVGKEYYKNDGTEATPTWTAVTVKKANDALGAEPAQVRRDGQTYYYMPISHLGVDGTIAKYGIVRNHLYDINVTGMSGFGSPVYNPGEVIIPTVPDDNKSYVAAKINVLQWRVVAQDVNLDHK